MELNSLNTKTGAAKGAFLHLKHPALGHAMWTGAGADEAGRLIDKAKAEKVGCTVLGLESERVREKARRLNKSKLEGGTDGEEEGLEFVCSLVTSFQGVTHEGKPLDVANARAFFEQSDGLVEQVLEFAGDRANFFKGGSTA